MKTYNLLFLALFGSNISASTLDERFHSFFHPKASPVLPNPFFKEPQKKAYSSSDRLTITLEAIIADKAMINGQWVSKGMMLDHFMISDIGVNSVKLLNLRTKKQTIFILTKGYP